MKRFDSKQQEVRSIRCPFNPAHIMPQTTFLSHLQKCQFPDKHLYAKCKFNSYHVILKDNMDDHQKRQCPDRFKYDNDDDDEWGPAPPSPKVQVKKEVKKKEEPPKVMKKQQKATVSDFDVDYEEKSHSIISNSSISEKQSSVEVSDF